MSSVLGDPVKMLRSCVITLLMALLANLAIWVVMVLIWRNRDFAGLITGFGSIVIVLGLCHGYVDFWKREGKKLGEQLRLAIDLTAKASAAGWVVALISLVGLSLLRPSGWTAWTYGIVWGIGGGVVFAVTFRIITKDLSQYESLSTGIKS